MIKENIIEYFKISSPSVIYDLDILENHLSNLEKTINSKINVLYSVKANTNQKIIEVLNSCDFIKGFECSSIHEFEKVKYFKDKFFSLIGPSFTIEDIKEVYREGYIYDFNSISQIKNMGKDLINRDIGVRINTVKSNIEYREENLVSRFGIKLYEFQDTSNYKYIENYNCKLATTSKLIEIVA